MAGSAFLADQRRIGVILVRSHSTAREVALDHGSPAILPVETQTSSTEAPAVIRNVRNALGIEIFPLQVIDSASEEAGPRIVVAEPLESRARQGAWGDLSVHREELMGAAVAFLGAPDSDSFPASFLAHASGPAALPWARPHWLSHVQRRADAYFGAPAAIQPYKLRSDRYILRVASGGQMYELHAAGALPKQYDAYTLQAGAFSPLLGGYTPEAIATWPDTGTTLRRAPAGPSLSTHGDLERWDLAMRRVVGMQLQLSSVIRQETTTYQDLVGQQLGPAINEWRHIPGTSSRFGSKAFEWIRECVLRSINTLNKSDLPNTLIPASLSTYTMYLNENILEVSELDSGYVGHPFMSLASLLSVRGGPLAQESQNRLALPFVEAWLQNKQGRSISDEVRAGIVAGSALQALFLWSRSSHARHPDLGYLAKQLSAWWEIIIRHGVE